METDMAWTLQDAKNKFSAVVDAALTGTPQEVSRRGKPAVVVLSASDYEQLVQNAVKARETFANHLLAFPIPDTDPQMERTQVIPRDVEF